MIPYHLRISCVSSVLARSLFRGGAHDLSYGISSSYANAVDAGDIVVCNVSRTIVRDALTRHPNVKVVLITAPAEILAQRIAARGREAAAGDRISRDYNAGIRDCVDVEINNVGTPEDSAQPLIALLEQLASSVPADKR